MALPSGLSSSVGRWVSLLAVVALLTACSATPAPSAEPSPLAGTPLLTQPVPAFSHVYVIVLENTSYDSIVGSPSAPYLNSLIAQGGLATNYFGVAHPSQPNYIALVSGSTQGITDDEVHDVDAPNLADQLESDNLSWAEFEQNIPDGCFTDARGSSDRDGPGTYFRKHNPFISFTSISGNPERCSRIHDFSAFDPAAANFELIVPNQTYDMHDGTIADADAFLSTFVPQILDSDARSQDGVLFIAWDESDDHSGNAGGHVPLIVISPWTPAGAQTDERFRSLLLVAHDRRWLPAAVPRRGV